MSILPKVIIEFTLSFVDVEGDAHQVTWLGPLSWDNPDSHPFKAQGLQFQDTVRGMDPKTRGEVFIPWHRIKQAILITKEVETWHDS
jgi:hypothetical protein